MNHFYLAGLDETLAQEDNADPLERLTREIPSTIILGVIKGGIIVALLIFMP